MTCRILLCTDGSSFARAASAVAIAVAAAHHDAKLTVLHVVNVVAPSGNVLKDIRGRLGFEPAVVDAGTEAAHTRRGEDVLAGVARDAEVAGVEVTLINDHGAVVDRIAHHARTSDLVIMGIRGTTEDTHPGQGGGHLDGVLSSILAPVLFVTRDHRTVRGVALGYDGSDGAARALRAAETVAGPLKLPLHAIFISADGTGGEVLDEAVRAYPDINVQKHVVVGEEPHTAMAKAAVAEGANLLAIGFRGRSQLKDFLYGSSCDFILMNTDLMVLVAR